MREAKDDGKKALNILRKHYLGTSTSRVMSLYVELTTLKMAQDENVTDYLIRAEKVATSLSNAKENITDSLLVSMVLKGLPPNYRTFSTIVTQRESEFTFMDFKVRLRNFEESEKSQTSQKIHEDAIMQTRSHNMDIKCYSCGKMGHKAPKCRKRMEEERKTYSSNRQNHGCENCKSDTRDTNYYRNKSVKLVNNR